MSLRNIFNLASQNTPFNMLLKIAIPPGDAIAHGAVGAVLGYVVSGFYTKLFVFVFKE